MRLRKPHVVDLITRMTYRELALIWITLVVILAGIYTILSYLAPNHGITGVEGMPIESRFLNSLYFSVMTATTVGYGDFLPLGISKVFASLEGMTAFVVMALLVTKLVSHRQDIALREVHKLCFEDIYHNVREELYVVRKDLDRVTEKAVEVAAFDDDDWRRLALAYQQISSILHEIPDFYDGVNDLYTIDAQREELLQEAVHRTLHRVNQTLDALSKAKIDWVSDEHSAAQLRELVETSVKIAAVWRKKSPYQREEAFERILHMTESIHARMEKALPMKDE